MFVVHTKQLQLTLVTHQRRLKPSIKKPLGKIYSSSPYAMAPFSVKNFAIKPQKPEKTSTEGLKKTVSDLSFQLNDTQTQTETETKSKLLPLVSEVENAKCECCSMSEECTPEYINRVREKFCGRWICGLCTEAVKEELERNGGKNQEAIDAHMSACVRFNRFGRVNPVLYQAEAMKQMLKKSSTLREKGRVKKAGNLARSSSCIPAIMKEI